MKSKKLYYGSSETSVRNILDISSNTSMSAELKQCAAEMDDGQTFTLYEITVKPLKKYKINRSLSEVKPKSGGKK